MEGCGNLLQMLDARTLKKFNDKLSLTKHNPVW